MTHFIVKIKLHEEKSFKFKLFGTKILIKSYFNFYQQQSPLKLLALLILNKTQAQMVLDLKIVYENLSNKRLQTKKTCGIVIIVKNMCRPQNLSKFSKFLEF